MNNLEWLYEHDREAMFDMVACGDKNCCECEISKYYPDCDLDENGTRREWLMSPHVDANDVFSGESVVTPETVDANDGNAMQDNREQLEADVKKWCGMYAYQVDMVWTWLNRQAAIIERHWMEICGASANANVELKRKIDALTQANGDLRDEWHRVCGERDELQRKLHESNREREQIRKQLGIAIDHAHDMIALVSVDTDEGAE